jgi:hypothetical protein
MHLPGQSQPQHWKPQEQTLQIPDFMKDQHGSFFLIADLLRLRGDCFFQVVRVGWLCLPFVYQSRSDSTRSLIYPQASLLIYTRCVPILLGFTNELERMVSGGCVHVLDGLLTNFLSLLYNPSSTIITIIDSLSITYDSLLSFARLHSALILSSASTLFGVSSFVFWTKRTS